MNARNKPGKVRGWGAVLGVTGGMGSGKSTVLEMFREKGAFALDADAIVRSLLREKSVLRSIRRSFGPKVFAADGQLDKAALAAEVFSSTSKRKRLEKLLHPRVRRFIWGELRRKTGTVAVVDIPLLYESGWQRKLDAVVVVSAGMERRLRRLKKKGFSAVDAKRRIKAQMSLREKERRADFVVDNNGPVQKTKKQVDAIWKKLPNITDGGN